MSDKKLRLTRDQLQYIMEQTQIPNPKDAIIYFASVMKMEGIRPRLMPEVVEKLIARQRKQIS